MIKYTYIAKYTYQTKYQLLINKREQADIKYFKDLRPFIEYSNTIRNVYPNIDDYNPKKYKILIAVDNMVADMLRKKKNKIKQMPRNHYSMAEN